MLLLIFHMTKNKARKETAIKTRKSNKSLWTFQEIRFISIDSRVTNIPFMES